MGKQWAMLGLVLLSSCGTQSVTEVAVEPTQVVQMGCQFEPVIQSELASTAGRYQQVQFTYLGDGEVVPKRFSADVLTFPPGAVRAELLDQPDLEKYQTVPEAAKTRGAIAAINGGYYGEEFEPIGLYILNGQSLQPMSNASGLLSGVVSIDAAGQLSLVTRTDFASNNVVSAFQSGPFLIDPGNVLGIYSDNDKLRKRTVVATSGNNDTVVFTTSSVSLYTLAQCLHTQPMAFSVDQIERALNLDGAISTGIYGNLSDGVLDQPEEVAVRSMLVFYQN